ncbi:hypothetical protein Q3F77_05975, partial [Enterococcus faecium]|nr:hypothetical protein [Enterococcus faecium]
VCCHEFKKTSHMAMESKKAYGFLFQISTKTNKKELAIKPLLFILLFLIFLTRKSHFSDNSGDKRKLCCKVKRFSI